jgi:hypothetical protein
VLLGITAFAVLVPVPHPSSVSVVGKTMETKTAPTPAKTVAVGSQAPEYYGESVRAGLFARPLPPEAPAPTESTQPQTLSGPTIEVPPPDIFADYVYTGTVTIDGKQHALLENTRTNEGSYYLPGDPFMGATVMQVDDNAVTLSVHGKMRRIPKSTAYNVVPLNAQAGASPDRGNPNGSQATALAAQKEQQMAAESLARAFSEGNMQATISSTGDGGNTVIFSIGDPNNP